MVTRQIWKERCAGALSFELSSHARSGHAEQRLLRAVRSSAGSCLASRFSGESDSIRLKTAAAGVQRAKLGRIERPDPCASVRVPGRITNRGTWRCTNASDSVRTRALGKLPGAALSRPARIALRRLCSE